MSATKGGAVNETVQQVLVFGVDPFGANQAAAIAAVAQRANAGLSGHVTINPVQSFRGDAGVTVQAFLGEGQLERNLGAAAADNNPVTTFHQSTSNAFDDPVMAALADQINRGGM